MKKNETQFFFESEHFSVFLLHAFHFWFNSISLVFFFWKILFRDLYTIFFLTKSAKKVRLLFLRGREARRGFFEEMDLRLKYHHCTSPGGFTG